MRKKDLLVLAVLQQITVHVSASQAICNRQSLMEEYSSQRGPSQVTVENSISNICQRDFVPPKTRSLRLDDIDVTINVSGNTTEHSVDSCIGALREIVSECCDGQTCTGGAVQFQDDITYELLYQPQGYEKSENEHVDLMARGRGGGRTRRPRPKATKSRPKSKPKPKAKAKPTPARKKTKPTRPSKSTKSSAAAKATPTKTCKQLYQQQLREYAIAERTTEKVSRDSVAFEKRSSPKQVYACQIKGRAANPSRFRIKALNYPDKGDMDAMTPAARYFGYARPEICTNFAFVQSGMLKAKVKNPEDYQVEHVLEWQTVADFFSWVRDKKITGTSFQVTNLPADSNICRYFKESWFGGSQVSFSLTNDGPERTVKDHLKWGFPGLDNRPKDFAFLHKVPNRLKAQMWAYKFGSQTAGIFAADSITEKIMGKTTNKKTTPKSIDQAKLAYLDLRALMAARKYMRSSKIAITLSREVKEMEKTIRKIDATLPQHSSPKKPAWVKQNLGPLWTEYMDERFKLANQRTTADMDKYIALLVKTWSPSAGSRSNSPSPGRGRTGSQSPGIGSSKGKGKAVVKRARTRKGGSKPAPKKNPSPSPNTKAAQEKDFFQEIRALEAAWKKEKSKPWRKPW
ncbi:glycosyl hydrolases family 18 protein [Paraphaeosphaeria sporulosa]